MFPYLEGLILEEAQSVPDFTSSPIPLTKPADVLHADRVATRITATKVFILTSSSKLRCCNNTFIRINCQPWVPSGSPQAWDYGQNSTVCQLRIQTENPLELTHNGQAWFLVADKTCSGTQHGPRALLVVCGHSHAVVLQVCHPVDMPLAQTTLPRHCDPQCIPTVLASAGLAISTARPCGHSQV